MAGQVSYVHLVTVGVSVLRNAYNALNACAGRGECGGFSLSPEEVREAVEDLRPCGVDPRSVDDVECQRRLRPGRPGWRAAEELLRGDPYRASAEINAMRDFLSYEQGRCERRLLDEAVLYHTDTHAGEQAARLLAGFLEECGVRAALRRVKGYGDPDRLFEGVAELARIAYCDIRRLRSGGSVVLLNLAGGFKPETGVMLLAGSLAGASAAYYIHEVGRRTVYLPLMPVRPALEPGEVRGLLEAMAGAGRVRLSDYPTHAWMVLLAEKLGAARRVGGDEYVLDARAAGWVGRYLEGLVGVGCPG